MVHIRFEDYVREETSEALGPFDYAQVQYGALQVGSMGKDDVELAYMHDLTQNWVWNKKGWSDMIISENK